MSTEVYEGIPLYEPESVANRLLNYRGMMLAHPAEPNWWEWLAHCASDSGLIDIGFTLFGTETPAWGGSEFEAVCELEALVQLWRHLRKEFAGIWLHSDECAIYTVESFRCEAVENFGLSRGG